MRRISTASTPWLNSAFPVLWFSFLAVMTLAGGLAAAQGQLPVPVLLIPLGMAVFGVVLMRYLVFPLADQVWIDKDDIVVQKNGAEDRFPISNVISVEYSRFTHPDRITLSLKEPCLFGREVIFSPQGSWSFGGHPIANEIIRRAHGIDVAE
jgi:hypothetical protein